MEYAKQCMNMRMGNTRYSAEPGVSRHTEATGLTPEVAPCTSPYKHSGGIVPRPRCGRQVCLLPTRIVLSYLTNLATSAQPGSGLIAHVLPTGLSQRGYIEGLRRDHLKVRCAPGPGSGRAGRFPLPTGYHRQPGPGASLRNVSPAEVPQRSQASRSPNLARAAAVSCVRRAGCRSSRSGRPGAGWPTEISGGLTAPTVAEGTAGPLLPASIPPS